MANELSLVTKSGLSGVAAKLHLNGLLAATAPMSETSTNVYTGNMPAILSGMASLSGLYTIAYVRNSGQPNERLIGTGFLLWDGFESVDDDDVIDALQEEITGHNI